MTRLSPLTAGALGLLLLSACQGSTPATPSTASGPAQVPEVVSVPADALIFGAWDLTLDPAAATASLVPSRAGAAFGDSWWLNATGFLNGAPCTDCLTVESIRLDPEGHPLVTFRARHPFAPGDPGLPPTGANRLDLHVFDAQLLVVGDLGNTTASFGAGSVTAPSRLVLNPAGFSGALTAVASALSPSLTATVFPYVTLAEDRTPGNWLNSNPGGFVDLQNPTGYNVFAMGADVTTEVTLGIEPLDGPVKLTLMFTASYGQSAVGRTNRLVPVYPLPEYNAKAPWKVEVVLASNDLAAGNAASTAEVSARVWDWQAAAPIDSSLNDIAAVRASSAPTSVELAVPALLSAPLNLGSPISGTGPFDDPLVYTALLVNELAAAEGSYTGLLRVVDDRATGLNAGGSPDALSSVNGSSIDPVTLTQFVTYQTLAIEVSGVARTLLSIDIAPDTRQIIAQGAGEAITFTATGNYDAAPFTEDLTATANWDSTGVDVATFAANVLTGIGMGTTQVTASFGSVNSDVTIVIVKPVEFLVRPINGGLGWELDAHQGNGEVYQALRGARQVEVYNPSGTLLRSWVCTVADLPQAPLGIAVDEANSRVFVADGGPSAPIWCTVYDLNGAKLNRYSMPGYTDSTALSQVANGDLWLAHFLPSPHYISSHNPDTGFMTFGGGGAGYNAPIGGDSKDELFYVANVGGRWTNQGIAIVDTTTNTTLAMASDAPSSYGQNDHLAVDRDGYIHVLWNGGPPRMQVYEYVPPSTITPLYEYSLSSTAQFLGTGITVSRPDNVVVTATFSPGVQTWFH